MTNNLPKFCDEDILDFLGLKCRCCEVQEKLQKFHDRPLYVISSYECETLHEAEVQINEWFMDGNLDPLTAVYKIDDYYIISRTEFDTKGEAEDQLLRWHYAGSLDKNARIYATSLSDTYEIMHLGLRKASLL